MFKTILLLLLLSCSMLTACVSGTPPTPEVIAVPSNPTVTIPSSLLVLCQDQLPALNSGALQALLENHIAGAKQYHSCATTHRNLVNAIRGQKGILIDGVAPTTTPALTGQPLSMRDLQDGESVLLFSNDMLYVHNTVVNAQHFGSFLTGACLRGQCVRVLSGVRGGLNPALRLYPVG